MTTAIPNGTRVEFNIAEGLVVGTGTIVDSRYDEGWFYHLEDDEITVGTAGPHLNADGQLWVCDFEVHQPLALQ